MVVPTFRSFCHAAGQRSGCSLGDTLYWFENALISLVPDTVFESDKEAAVAKATEFGLKTGRGRFRIVLLSIFRAIFVQVSSESEVIIVEQSPVISIGNFCDKQVTKAAHFRCDGDCKLTALDQMILNNTGFRSLQTFVGDEGDLQLPRGRGVFPPEIYARMIAEADFETRRTCAAVSTTFRSLCRQQPSFGKTSMVLKFDVSTTIPSFKCQGGEHRRSVKHAEVGTFTIRDQLTGRTSQLCLNTELDATAPVLFAQKQFNWWCPVFGNGARLSIMTQLQFRTGRVPDSVDEDGTHEDGTHEDGTHEDGTHEDGTHEDGTDEDVTDEDVTDEGMTDEDGADEDGDGEAAEGE